MSNGEGIQPSTIAGASGFVASLVSTSMPLSCVVGISPDTSNGTTVVTLAAERQISATKQITFMAELMGGGITMQCLYTTECDRLRVFVGLCVDL